MRAEERARERSLLAPFFVSETATMAKDIQAQFDAPRKPGRKKKVRPSVSAVYDAALHTRAQKDGTITHKAIAAHFGITVTTWQVWRKEQPQYDVVIEQAKNDDLIEIAGKARELFLKQGSVPAGNLYVKIMHQHIDADKEPVQIKQKINVLPTPQAGFKKPDFAIIDGDADRIEPPAPRNVADVIRDRSKA
jgi:hypothetical protein